MKKILLFFFILGSISQICFANNYKTPITILKIYDGDTIQAKIENNVFNVRLSGIDCFESYKNNRAYKQAILNNLTVDEVIKKGKLSTKFLENLYQKSNKKTYLDFKGIDKYNRALGILYFDDKNINNILIQNGGCMIYNYSE